MSITTIKKLTSTPFIVDIPTSQWNGENGNFYITVNASNITANSILVPSYDYNSADLFAGTKLWCEPANGSFTINVDVKPTGTVTVLVQFMGVVGEANYQVLSDVYSKSQTDELVAQSTAAFAGTNKSWYHNVDLDTFTVSGYYPVGTPLTNAPGTWGILVVIAVKNDTIEQIFYGSSNHIYRREYRIVSGSSEPVWSAWSELATVDYVAQSTAYFSPHNLGDNIDFNTVKQPGVYYVGGITSATNAPQNVYGYLCMIVLSSDKSGSGIGCQILVGGRESVSAAKKIWVRYYNGNNFYPWYSLQLT